MSKEMAFWRRGSFSQMYAEADVARELFDGYTRDILRLCNDGGAFPSIKTNFTLAEQHYKEAMKIVQHLSLWHTAKVEGKPLSEWPQNALLRGLEGMLSSVMNHLLSVYRIWLSKDQFTHEMARDEDDVGAL
jgi:hypothetical protein